MDNGAIGFFLFFVILIIIWIFAMGGCVRERKSFGVYEGLDDTKTISFSIANPYQNTCQNQTISNESVDITAAEFDNIQDWKSYGAKMNQTCQSRGFTTKVVKLRPLTTTISGHTVNWDGQVWTK